MKTSDISILFLALAGGAFAAKNQPIPTLAPGLEPPRLFLQSASHGNNWNARRDQSMEMSKDFQKECPNVKITLNQQMADYTIILNHIEHGLARDNQLQVVDKNGDQLSVGEGGSIAANVKRACILVITNWNSKAAAGSAPTAPGK
jgi:hypothetical protein